MLDSAKRNPQIALLAAGVLAVLLALGSDFLGLGARAGLGTRQLVLLAGGAAAALAGLAWDLVSGRRLTLAWAREHASSRSDLFRALGIVLQLAVLLLIGRTFNLENGAFHDTLLVLVLFGFSVHYLLPQNLRLPFFILLSGTGFLAILGLTNTLLIAAGGLVLILLARLPAAYGWRIALVGAAAAVLGLLRADLIDTSIPTAIWPIFGAIFMFRLVIYINDTRNLNNRPSLEKTLGYFFLLPNAIFPLFPVIDLKVFRRTYFNADQFKIYQQGVDWILRGFIHLLLYRVINYYFVLGPGQVENVADLGQMMVANYTLYLRVSGQFHIIAGILHLFGFNLPETHHLYFLATNFSEIWRRMNIYWKDFIQKIFFYPVYFKARRFGDRAGLVLATIASFVATWLLHAYQWFWLRGSFLFTVTDGVFWIILASLVLWNSLRAKPHARDAYAAENGPPPRELLVRTLKASGVFFFMSALWTFWISPSPGAFFDLVSGASVTPGSLTTLFFIAAGVVLAIGAGIWYEAWSARPERTRTRFLLLQHRTARTLVFGALLFTLGSPAVMVRTSGRVQSFLNDIRVSRLSERDRNILELGYYEDLIGVDRFNPDLWDLYVQKPVSWIDLANSDAVQIHNSEFIPYELLPSHRTVFHNTLFITNQWGMRDQPYELEKPEGTFRIALVGSSRTMGSGVVQEKIFEALVEDRLNENTAGDEIQRYEILNFSVGGYTFLENLARLETRILTFQPDMVILVPHPEFERTRSFRHVADRVQAGVPMPFPFLDRIVAEAGVTAEMPEEAALRMLLPFGKELYQETFAEYVEEITAHGAVPVLLSYPNIIPEQNPENLSDQLRIAEDAGFHILNLATVFDGTNRQSLVVAPWDYHPNAAGHRLIADALYDALLSSGLLPGP